jgi:hypothetical protein
MQLSNAYVAILLLQNLAYHNPGLQDFLDSAQNRRKSRWTAYRRRGWHNNGGGENDPV